MIHCFGTCSSSSSSSLDLNEFSGLTSWRGRESEEGRPMNVVLHFVI